GPVVIVIDGLQWADRPSLELLQDLLARKDARPILVLLVTRPDDRVAPFLEGMVRIELRGLTADEQMRLVEARLGVRQGVAAVCRELVPRVAGNPFFLLEMIDALLERGPPAGTSRCPRRWSRSSAIACASCRRPSTTSSTGSRSPAARSSRTISSR